MALKTSMKSTNEGGGDHTITVSVQDDPGGGVPQAAAFNVDVAISWTPDQLGQKDVVAGGVQVSPAPNPGYVLDAASGLITWSGWAIPPAGTVDFVVTLACARRGLTSIVNGSVTDLASAQVKDHFVSTQCV